MVTFITYLLHASAGISIFYIVYWLFLRNEIYHHANRWFLLATLILSVFLPVFPVHYTVFVEQGINTNFLTTIPDTFNFIPAITNQEAHYGAFDWQKAVISGYLTGVAIFLLRLLIQTSILVRIIVTHNLKEWDGLRILENKKYNLPFSFFNIVFINPEIHKQENLKEILAHEKVHIHENHWFDLLLIELLTVIFWFNPFIWFFERSIKQNHEYLADKGVLAQGHPVGRYQALLINQLMGIQIIGITNNLHYALNTKRLKMMTKTKKSPLGGIKFLLTLPAIALLLFAFSEPEYKVNVNQVANPVAGVQQTEQKLAIQGRVVEDESGKPLHGASVVITGTTTGTVTDESGEFTLADPNPKKDDNGRYYSNLAISYVGMETRIMTAKAAGNKPVAEVPDIKMKDGIIVINQKLLDLPPPPPPLIIEKKFSDAPPPPPAKGQEEIYVIVEELPEYPDGYYSLGEYIRGMQKRILQSNNISGKSKIGFTVSKTGKVTDVKIVEQDNAEVGKAAAGIVMNMKDWNPGKQRGQPVAVKYLIPIEFN